MRLRSLTASVAAVMVASGVTLANAPAASAATIVIDTDCAAPIVLNAAVGDTIVIRMTGCLSSSGVLTNVNGTYPGDATNAGYLATPTSTENPGASGSSSWGDIPGNDWYVYSDGSGLTVITTTLLAQDGAGTPLSFGRVIGAVGPTGGATYLITYGLPDVATDAPPPPDWNQAYARATADEVCLAGWKASYADWPNAGKGGPVCVQTVRYNVALRAWQTLAE